MEGKQAFWDDTCLNNFYYSLNLYNFYLWCALPKNCVFLSCQLYPQILEKQSYLSFSHIRPCTWLLPSLSTPKSCFSPEAQLHGSPSFDPSRSNLSFSCFSCIVYGHLDSVFIIWITCITIDGREDAFEYKMYISLKLLYLLQGCLTECLTRNDYMVNEGKNLAYTTLMWRQARYVVGRRNGY